MKVTGYLAKSRCYETKDAGYSRYWILDAAYHNVILLNKIELIIRFIPANNQILKTKKNTHSCPSIPSYSFGYLNHLD